MSISNTASTVGPVTITALPQTIAVSFPFQVPEDLTLIDYGVASGTGPYPTPVLLALNSDYVVSGGGYNSSTQMQTGSVQILSGGTGGVGVSHRIVIFRTSAITQETGFQTTGTLTAQMIEQMGDKLTMIGDQLNRGLAFIPFGTPASSTAAGIPGQILYDVQYLYVAVGPTLNLWSRVPLTTW